MINEPGLVKKDDILIVGKAEVGELEFQPAEVDMPTICKAVIRDL